MTSLPQLREGKAAVVAAFPDLASFPAVDCGAHACREGSPDKTRLSHLERVHT